MDSMREPTKIPKSRGIIHLGDVTTNDERKPTKNLAIMLGGRRRVLFQLKPGGNYRIRFKVDDRDIERSLYTTDETDAEVRAREIFRAETQHLWHPEWRTPKVGSVRRRPWLLEKRATLIRRIARIQSEIDKIDAELKEAR
jgi:hypothetical protein